MERFDYEGYHKIPSFCFIEIYAHEKVTVVIATEPDYDTEDSGTSITNRAEHIATRVCQQHNIEMIKLVWIEHYDRQVKIGKKETWDLVTFTREKTPVRGYWEYPRGQMVFTSPKWQPLSEEQKDRLVTGDLDVFKELKAPVRDAFFS